MSCTYFCDRFDGTMFADFSMTIINVLGAVPMAIAMAFIWPLSRKYGKRIVVMVGLLIGAVGGLLAGIWSDNFYVVCLGVALKSFGSSPACYMILAMLSDVLDHIEAKTGYRCDGLTMSIYSSIMAATGPLSTGVFNAMTGNGTNTMMVTVSYIWIETAVYCACALLMVFFVVEKYLKSDKKSLISAIKRFQFIWDMEGNPINYNPQNRPRRQDWDGYYIENGAFYISSRKNILKSNCRITPPVEYWEMSEKTIFEVDEPEDIAIIENLFHLD